MLSPSATASDSRFSRFELRLAQTLVFVAPAMWGVNYLVARWAPGVIAPHALALGRFVQHHGQP